MQLREESLILKDMFPVLVIGDEGYYHRILISQVFKCMGLPSVFLAVKISSVAQFT